MKNNFIQKYFQGWSIKVHEGVCIEDIYRIISKEEGIFSDKSKFIQTASSLYAKVFCSFLKYNNHLSKIYIKQYLFRSYFDFIKHLFRDSRAKRSFQASLMLRKFGFNAPQPLGIMEKKIGFLTTDSIFIAVDVPDSISLGDVLKGFDINKSEAGLHKKRKIIHDFGSTVGLMHYNGIIHGDTRLGNVLVQRNEDDYKFWFIDNERTKRFLKPSLRLFVKNLDQINIRAEVSNTDRLRFIKAYGERQSLTAEEIRNLSRMVMKRTRRRQEKRAARKVKST